MSKGKFLLLAVVLSILSSVFAFGYPQIGHQFYGYAGSGSTVTIVVGDLTYSTSVESDNYYGYDPLFFVDAASDDIEGAEEGETLTFYLDGTKITTVTFESGGVTKVDFIDDPATTSVETAGAVQTTAESSSPVSTAEEEEDDDSKSSKKKSTTTAEEEAEDCAHAWKCTNWSECQANGFQTRTCFYIGDCKTEGNQTDTRQKCEYVASEEKEEYVAPEASCSDNIKNQGERGVDCGGPCEACPTVPIQEEPKTNWLYIGLGVFLILLIIAIILAHKYKDKLLPYWEKFKSKLGIKSKAVAQMKATVSMPQRQAQYQQYPPYKPAVPNRVK